MKAFAVFAGLLSGFLFGLATPASKLLLGRVDPFCMAGLLYLGAAAFFVPFLMKNMKSECLALRRSDKKVHLLGIMIFGGFLGPLFLMFGLRSADASAVSVLLNMELVATALLGVTLFRDHLDRFGVTGVALTAAAGIVATAGEHGSGLVPGVLVILACFAWGMDNHLTALIDGVSPQTITFVKGVFGGGVNLAIGLVAGGAVFDAVTVPIALVIGMFSYGMSIVLYVTSAQNLGATRSQILFSTAPFWGIAASSVLVGEEMTPNILFAAGLLVSGIVFTSMSWHRHEHFHHDVCHIHLHGHDDGHHDHEHPGSAEAGARHSHLHEHKETVHSHSHYPDLHHRHGH